ncbi:MAG: glycosyltransferase, partial [Bacteroidia bacterium]
SRLKSLTFQRKLRITVFVTGLGAIFVMPRLRFLRLFLYVFKLLKWEFVFQNSDDLLELNRYSSANSLKFIIPGTPLDFSVFKLKGLNQGPLRVGMVARILKDKGVDDYISLANDLKLDQRFKFYYYGDVDINNPNSFNKAIIKRRFEEADIVWIDDERNISDIYTFDIACLFSKREGFPRVIIEAGSQSIPTLIKNNKGIRHSVIDDINGYKFDTMGEVKSCLVKLCSARNELLNLKKSSYDYTLKHFETSSYLKSYLSVLNNS